jgi:transposase
MLRSDEQLTVSEIARTAECSRKAVYHLRSNLELFGNAKAPPNRPRQQQIITPTMLKALCDYLLEKPTSFLDEMAVFLSDEFDVEVSISTISRTLASIGWSKKVARQKAKERNKDLRDEYVHYISDFSTDQLVFVDESGCDKRAGFRRTGWSPLGIAPLQICKFHRDRRYQILPAYAHDGIVLSRIFQGSTDAEIFEDFIENLLEQCGKWPEPKSVIIMDNASFHRSDRIDEMCLRAGVKLAYLPPYSPDLNPIEEFFAELKAFIRRNWKVYEEDPNQGFDRFLEWCVDTVGAREHSARGHFRHAGLATEEV